MDLKHWKLDVDADHLAWLTFDRAGSATNTFSSETLRELDQIADHLASMPPKGLAILSAKDRFAAGADIKEFVNLKDPDEAMALRPSATVFDKITKLPFPSRDDPAAIRMGGAGALARDAVTA